MENFGPDGFIRSRRPQVPKNIDRPRVLETKLSNSEITAYDFLLQGSYTYENFTFSIKIIVQWDIETPLGIVSWVLKTS